MTRPVDPIGVALLVTRALDPLGLEHTIGGSIASSFAGEPRSTLDIDIVVAMSEQHVDTVVRALEGEFYLDAEALRSAVRDKRNVNAIHTATNIQVGIFVAGGTPLDGQQIRRRRRVTLGPGRMLYVHPPEDILLQKLRWYRQGGETSDGQWRDVLAIIRVQGPALDRHYVTANAPAIGVADLLVRAFDEAGTPP